MALTSEEIGAIIAGRRGKVDYRIRLYESSVLGQKGALLRGVEEIAVTMHNFNDWTWELTATVTDNHLFNFDVGYAMAYLELRAGAEDWSEYPMGLFRFESPSGSHDISTTWELTGYSLEALALADTTPKGFYVPANTKILDHCRLILQTMVPPIPASRVNFPVEAVASRVPSAVYFDPMQDVENTRKLRIINTLLNAGGYRSLYTDRYGRFTTSKIQDYRTAPADIFYSTMRDREVIVGGRHMVSELLIKTETISDQYDEENFANRVVVQSGDNEDATPVIVVVENNDANDPLSIIRYRRVKQLEPIVLQSVVSEAEAYLIGLEALARAAGRYRTVTFSTPLDPRREQNEHYQMEVFTGKNSQMVVSGKWRVLDWTISDDGMEHNIARIEGGDNETWPSDEEFEFEEE